MTAFKDQLRVKRVYDAPEEADGFRVLADRLWPRGLTKDKARIDLWAKALSPSDALRRKVHADPDYPAKESARRAFLTAYAGELEEQGDEFAKRAELIGEIGERLRKGPVTLLYGAKDETFNNAVALREWLWKRL